MNKNKEPYLLAIESSCDDTSAAVLQGARVLSNVVTSQLIHQEYGGVVPELASRAHQRNILTVVDYALKQANIEKKQLSAVAYTRGPGLLGSLLVGTSFAKSLALGLGIKLIDVNHMQAHLLAHFIEDEEQTPPRFPFLGLTISGGHTQIVQVNDYFDLELLGETLDDAVGECFDKSAKLLGFDYPGGPEIDRWAKDGNPKAFSFPIPKVEGLNFSFSGLKTGILRLIQKEQANHPNFIEARRADLCASIQSTIVEILSEKIQKAIGQTGISTLAIAGGVAANQGIRLHLKSLEAQGILTLHLPRLAYCTDNAAMIGIVGYLKLKENQLGLLTDSTESRYTLNQL